MPMRIVCPNCGKQFSAWDDLVGKAVECPKCHQKTVIGGPNEALETPAPAKPASKPSNKPVVPPAPGSVPAGQGRVNPAAQPAARQKNSTSLPPAPLPPSPNARPAAGKPVPTRQAAPPVPPRATPAARTVSPRQPVTAPDHDDDDSLPNGCPNCNATMAPNDDLCDHCGYHLVLKKVIDISDMPKKNTATGFERIFKEQLNDPESTSHTLLWIKIAGSLFLLLILYLVLGKWWWIGVLVIAGAGGLYWMKLRQQSADAQTGSVNRDPVSLVIWSMLLTIQRVIGWRKMEWPFPKARSLTLCDPAFNDDELDGLERLNELEAMDLEGTGITDEGLEPLRPLKQLRYLVLRRTQVSPGAAQRLQQDLPKTLIWF